MGRPHIADLVRILENGTKVRWWPSGDSRIGKAKNKTIRDPAERDAFVAAKRLVLAAGGNLVELSTMWLASIAVEGTEHAYESTLNCWLLPYFLNDHARALYAHGELDGDGIIEGGLPPSAISSDMLEDALDTGVQGGATPSNVDAMMTAFGSFCTWLVVKRKITGHPVPGPVRRDLAKRWSAAARRLNPSATRTVDVIGDWDDVCRIADEVDLYYPGTGSAAVRVLAGCGLRIAEFVGLTTADVDLDQGLIRVRRQADRYQQWPAVIDDLKDHEVREVRFWEIVRDDVEFLVDNAVDGWLLPPSMGQGYWLEAIERAINRASKKLGYEFRCHGLRAHFATYSLEPAPHGYGVDEETVSRELGHHSVAYTRARYKKSLKVYAEAAKLHRERTRTHPSQRERLAS